MKEETLKVSPLQYIYAIVGSMISAFCICISVFVAAFPWLYLIKFLKLKEVLQNICKNIPFFDIPEKFYGYSFSITKWLFPFIVIVGVVVLMKGLRKPIKKVKDSQYTYDDEEHIPNRLQHYKDEYSFRELLQEVTCAISRMRSSCSEYLKEASHIKAVKQKFDNAKTDYESEMNYYTRGKMDVFFLAVIECIMEVKGVVAIVVFSFVWEIAGSIITLLLCGAFRFLSKFAEIFGSIENIVNVAGLVLTFCVPVLLIAVAIICVCSNCFRAFDANRRLTESILQLKSCKESYERDNQKFLNAYADYLSFKFLTTNYKGYPLHELTCFSDIQSWDDWTLKWSMSLSDLNETCSKAKEFDFFEEAAANAKDYEYLRDVLKAASK